MTKKIAFNIFVGNVLVSGEKKKKRRKKKKKEKKAEKKSVSIPTYNWKPPACGSHQRIKHSHCRAALLG